jgi:hypothetical protein
MRLLKHLLIIGLVVPAIGYWSAAIASNAHSRSARNIVSLVQRLSRSSSTHVEIVAFADPHFSPVKVVRGGASLGPAAMSSAQTAPIQSSAGGSVQLVSFADPDEQPVTVLRGSPAEATAPGAPKSGFVGLFGAPGDDDLDRIAFAVDSAESSNGTDPAMWRPDLDGPEGPMQVSLAAAIDSGGGDRFDLVENRRLGRAYLALLYRRYGNWPDAVAAYNWGPGNLDAWIECGRPPLGLPIEVERYRDRVLYAGALPGSNHMNRDTAR